MNGDVTLKHLGSNQVLVRVNCVDMYFSYDACIAFDASECKIVQERPRLRNPAYVGYSAATTKHAGQMGVARWPAADSADEFRRLLSQALG